jgi:hypothetical protein
MCITAFCLCRIRRAGSFRRMSDIEALFKQTATIRVDWMSRKMVPVELGWVRSGPCPAPYRAFSS